MLCENTHKSQEILGVQAAQLSAGCCTSGLAWVLCRHHGGPMLPSAWPHRGKNPSQRDQNRETHPDHTSPRDSKSLLCSDSSVFLISSILLAPMPWVTLPHQLCGFKAHSTSSAGDLAVQGWQPGLKWDQRCTYVLGGCPSPAFHRLPHHRGYI